MLLGESPLCRWGIKAGARGHLREAWLCVCEFAGWWQLSHCQYWFVSSLKMWDLFRMNIEIKPLPAQVLIDWTLFYSNAIEVQPGEGMVSLLHPSTFTVFGVLLILFIFLEEFTLNFLQNQFPCVFISSSLFTHVYWRLQCLKALTVEELSSCSSFKSECILDAI